MEKQKEKFKLNENETKMRLNAFDEKRLVELSRRGSHSCKESEREQNFSKELLLNSLDRSLYNLLTLDNSVKATFSFPKIFFYTAIFNHSTKPSLCPSKRNHKGLFPFDCIFCCWFCINKCSQMETSLKHLCFLFTATDQWRKSTMLMMRPEMWSSRAFIYQHSMWKSTKWKKLKSIESVVNNKITFILQWQMMEVWH